MLSNMMLKIYFNIIFYYIIFLIPKNIFNIVTGIQDVVFKPVQSDAIYNLHGQRVLSRAKGIYIRDGKKIMMK